MKVIATATGFDGKKVRNAGDEFEMPDKSKASWFVPVESEKPEKKAKTESESESKTSTGLV